MSGSPPGRGTPLGSAASVPQRILARPTKSWHQEVVTGVFETLKVLEQYQIEPFKDGYEGSPFNDFIGRLADWNWPEAQPDASPNGGPASRSGNSGVSEGPPSVS